MRAVPCFWCGGPTIIAYVCQECNTVFPLCLICQAKLVFLSSHILPGESAAAWQTVTLLGEAGEVGQEKIDLNVADVLREVDDILSSTPVRDEEND